jgi:hypothetical protein
MALSQWANYIHDLYSHNPFPKRQTPNKGKHKLQAGVVGFIISFSECRHTETIEGGFRLLVDRVATVGGKGVEVRTK